MEELNNAKKCVKCKEKFEYAQEDTWWDYKGYTNTKLVKCPICGCIQAVQYEKLNNLNYDRRYYD